jgi:hypothetical protein
MCAVLGILGFLEQFHSGEEKMLGFASPSFGFLSSLIWIGFRRLGKRALGAPPRRAPA